MENRVKGRDLYDYVFYLSKGTPVNLKHLKERLIQSGHIDEQVDFTLKFVKQKLTERFENIDFIQAKMDINPFIRDASMINLWCSDFFIQITMGLKET